jgi:hypothetical protein
MSPRIAGLGISGAWPVSIYQKAVVQSLQSTPADDDLQKLAFYNVDANTGNGYYGKLVIVNGRVTLSILRLDAFNPTVIAGPLTLGIFKPGDTFYYSLDGVRNHVNEYNGIQVQTAIDSTYPAYYPTLFMGWDDPAFGSPPSISYYEAGINASDPTGSIVFVPFN